MTKPESVTDPNTAVAHFKLGRLPRAHDPRIPHLSALLAAAREATVNAAKWSGAGVISLFAEVEAGEVSIVVRDRGKGFDPEAVPEDRKGLAESVHGRMARRGGTAIVTTAPGEGTKVTLKMPRSTLTAGRT